MKILFIGVVSLFFAILGFSKAEPWQANLATEAGVFLPEAVYAASSSSISGIILSENIQLTFNDGSYKVSQNKTLAEVRADIILLCAQLLKENELLAHREFCEK